MEQNQSIASSRYKIYVVPRDGSIRSQLIALVEDFTLTDQLTPEMLIGIGDFTPSDSVVNTMTGMFRWGRVHRWNPELLQIIRPRVSTYAAYPEFDLLAVDPIDNKPIARAIGCRPQTLDTNVTNGRAVRENFNALCRFIQRFEEVNASSQLTTRLDAPLGQAA